MPNNSLKSQWIMLALCAAVGLMAAVGAFGNINHFPLVFAAILALINAWETWSRRESGLVARRLAVIGLGVLLACGGWWFHQGRVQRHIDAAEREIRAQMIGTPAPPFDRFVALNVDQEELDRVLEGEGTESTENTENTVTLVTFWARWCSPCWQEMKELDALYEAHRADGLRVVGITRYDNPDDPEARQAETDKAKRFLERRRYRFPTGIGRGEMTYAGFRVRSPPVTVLIDATGTIVDYALGLDSARRLMRKATALTTGAG